MIHDCKDFAAVVVHYDSVDTLSETVRSLRRYLPAERIFVVDNSSSLNEKTADIEAVVLDDGLNHGYAGGVNLGIRHVTRTLDAIREVLVCTHETIFRDDAIFRLFQTANQYPGGHLVGPRLVTRNDDGEVVTWSNGGSYSLPFLYPKHNLGRRVDGVANVRWVDGAAFVMDTSTWERLGGIPEEFFMYMEDVAMGELCRRHEIPVVVDLGAVVEQSANGPSRFLAIRNRVLLARRYMTWTSKLTVLSDVFMRQLAMSLHPRKVTRAKSQESRDAVRAAKDIYRQLGRVQ